MAVAVDDSSI